MIKTNVPTIAKGNNVAYYCNIRKQYIIDNYVAKTLPLHGWFKYCSECGHITSHSITFCHKNKDINIPLCYHCERANIKHDSVSLLAIDIVSDIMFSS